MDDARPNDTRRDVRQANKDVSAGRLRMAQGEISGRTEGRFRDDLRARRHRD